jgi:hypothetical protein
VLISRAGQIAAENGQFPKAFFKKEEQRVTGTLLKLVGLFSGNTLFVSTSSVISDKQVLVEKIRHCGEALKARSDVFCVSPYLPVNDSLVLPLLWNNIIACLISAIVYFWNLHLNE